MKFTEAFVYAGVLALHAAVVIDGAVWVHRTPFPEMRNPSIANPGLLRLMRSVRERGYVNPEHWEMLGATSWRP